MRNGVFAFLPWLNLEQEIDFGGFTFAHLFPAPDQMPKVLRPFAARFLPFLDLFRDSSGSPLRSGTFVFPASAAWELSDTEMAEVERLLGPLFLACYARNEYYSRLAGSYVNSAAFSLYFCVPTAEITFELRRRDGFLPHYGSPRGAFHFYMPSQCTGLGTARCDVDLIRAFELARSQKAPVLDKLESALGFFEFANRDDSSISMRSELVMMVAAYEHLLQSNAWELSISLAELFQPFASGKTVGDARLRGREVFQDPKHDTQLVVAPIHQGWIYEFHKRRSAAVHPTRLTKWGWTPFEHLLVAAFVFPLIAKLLFERDGFYHLTADDEGCLKAVDDLLIARCWSGIDADQGWAGIVRIARMRARFNQALINRD